MTLIVNHLGPPGAGKSTTSAAVFARLKRLHVNCEYVTEVAKDFTWSQRFNELRCQPYIFGKQLRDLERVMGQVDVVITDSPLILSAYYGPKYAKGAYHDSFYEFVIEQYRRMGGLTFLLRRDKPYNPKGRNQTEEESDAILPELRDILMENAIYYTELAGNESAEQRICHEIMRELAL